MATRETNTLLYAGNTEYLTLPIEKEAKDLMDYLLIYWYGGGSKQKDIVASTDEEAVQKADHLVGEHETSDGIIIRYRSLYRLIKHW